jgi:adenylate cyclase
LTKITRRLAAVAFADVAGWAHLVEENELDAVRSWNALRTGLIEPKIQEHGGRLVDIAGDAVFVEFPSAVDALTWALALQRRTPGEAGEARGRRLDLRIGLHVGDLLVDGQRLAGDAVNIAARIHQTASPGEIVVTEAVREHVLQRIPVNFRDLGERKLKNISRLVRIYRVEADAPAALEPVDADADAVQRAMRTLLALDMAPSGRAPEDDRPEAALQLRKLHDYLAREVLPASGGRVVVSDAGRLLVDFPDARPAVQAAFAIQQACSSAAAGLNPHGLPRMGVQMSVQMSEVGGEALVEGAAVHRGSAGIATRLSAIAAPGEIIASSTVCDALTSALDAAIEDLGERDLEEMSQPVRAYRLDPPQSQPSVEPGDAADDLRPTIAVIPFAEHGHGNEALGEILAEEVIAALSQSADLHVVSRLSTTAFRGRAATLGEVSAHLKANYVLSGSYRVSFGALILAAELAETGTGRVVWAKDLKGSIAGVVEGEDELIDRVVLEASNAVIARELERTQSQSMASLETYSLLIGGIARMHRLSPQDFGRARDMLRVVAQRAPRHAIPRAWLAKWHVLRVWQGWSDDVSADTRLALDCTKHALDNDSHCSLALAIDGFVHTNLLKRLDIAQQRYDLALRVNPNDPLAWSLQGMLHAFKGEGKEAVKGTQRALRLSPLDPCRFFYDSLAGGAELAAGHYERAVELTRRSLRANRMHASTFRMLAISQWQLGRHDEARATVAELMKIEPTLTVTQWFERSPANAYPIGRLCADALRNAGVPR